LSVSSECRSGDSIYIIEGFISKTNFDNQGLVDIENSLEQQIGNKVIYLDWFNKNIGDNLYTMIKYKDSYDIEIEAVETYFVTEKVWNGLEKHFNNG
jgi:hypothetical protein